MNLKEFKKLIDTDKDVMNKALKCENIGEFKEFSNEENVEYNTDTELNQAWSYVQGKKIGENGELNEDALDSVAGGAKSNTHTGFGLGSTMDKQGNIVYR